MSCTLLSRLIIMCFQFRSRKNMLSLKIIKHDYRFVVYFKCCIILYIFRWTEATVDNLSNIQNHNITLLLDSLLQGYDKHLRPDFGGKN